MPDEPADLGKKRAEENELLRRQVFLRIEYILESVQDKIMTSDDYQMIDGTGRRVSIYPLGAISPTRIDATDLNANAPLFCDCFLYLGTDGNLYAYGLGNDAKEGAVLTYREVDLKAEDAPIRCIFELLTAIAD